MEKIRVVVRVRPETERAQRNVVNVLGNLICLTPRPQSTLHANKEHQFFFDRVFGEYSTQDDVFGCLSDLLPGLTEGRNLSVFCYGATGSGKTFTMMGNRSNKGVMGLTLTELFRLLRMSDDVTIRNTVKLSMFEVYNENLRDLLGTDEVPSPTLELRDDSSGGAQITNLKWVEVAEVDTVLHLLHTGTARRTCATTIANEVSSRSHAVMQLVLERRMGGDSSTTEITTSKLCMVDLAGSERASQNQNTIVRFKEGANINRSLLALGNCINALARTKRSGFVPYRDSKLTRILKDALGGNCKTVMIGNISPSESCFEDSLNTLRFANRAKQVTSQLTRNVRTVGFQLSQYVEEIRRLTKENSELRKKIHEDPLAAPSCVPDAFRSSHVTSKWTQFEQLSEDVVATLGRLTDCASIKSATEKAFCNLIDTAATASDNPCCTHEFQRKYELFRVASSSYDVAVQELKVSCLAVVQLATTASTTCQPDAAHRRGRTENKTGSNGLKHADLANSPNQSSVDKIEPATKQPDWPKRRQPKPISRERRKQLQANISSGQQQARRRESVTRARRQLAAMPLPVEYTTKATGLSEQASPFLLLENQNFSSRKSFKTLTNTAPTVVPQECNGPGYMHGTASSTSKHRVIPTQLTQQPDALTEIARSCAKNILLRSATSNVRPAQTISVTRLMR